MVGTKNNRRTKYTIQLIKEAFLSLLKDTDLSKITVTEICKRADINRGTFYLHFQDPFDLFSEIESDLMEQIRPILALKPQEHLHEWLKRVICILKENEAASRIILADYQNSKMVKEIFTEVHDLAINVFMVDFDEKDPRLLEYYFTYFVKGTLGTILEWLNNDHETTVDELTIILTKLLSRTTHRTFES